MLERYKGAYMEINKDQIVKNCNRRKVKGQHWSDATHPAPAYPGFCTTQ